MRWSVCHLDSGSKKKKHKQLLLQHTFIKISHHAQKLPGEQECVRLESDLSTPWTVFLDTVHPRPWDACTDEQYGRALSRASPERKGPRAGVAAAPPNASGLEVSEAEVKSGKTTHDWIRIGRE